LKIAQFNSLQEELLRRRDEIIQLKAVLQQQSQSLKAFGSSNGKDNDNELLEAFQAQKNANK